MRYLKYGLGALVIYLVFLAVTVPVSLVWQFSPKPKGVQVSGLEGTVWAGRADTVTVAGRRLENLTWDLDPWWALIGGQLEAVVSVSGDVQGRGTVRYGFSGLEVEGLRLESPISTLVGNRRLPFRTKVAGEVKLNLTQGSQGEPWCEALNGRITVQQLDVNNQFGAFPLGNLAGTLSCKPGQPAADHDRSGQPHRRGRDGSAQGQYAGRGERRHQGDGRAAGRHGQVSVFPWSARWQWCLPSSILRTSAGLLNLKGTLGRPFCFVTDIKSVCECVS